VIESAIDFTLSAKYLSLISTKSIALSNDLLLESLSELLLELELDPEPDPEPDPPLEEPPDELELDDVSLLRLPNLPDPE